MKRRAETEALRRLREAARDAQLVVVQCADGRVVLTDTQGHIHLSRKSITHLSRAFAHEQWRQSPPASAAQQERP